MSQQSSRGKEEPIGKKLAQDSWGRRNRRRSKSSLFAAGEPMVWLTGGALAICALMVAGLILLVLVRGLSTFWPGGVVHVTTPDGRVFMGEITRDDTYRPTQNVIDDLDGTIAQNARRELEESEGWARRELMRTGNFKLTQNHFAWVSDWEISERTEPEWAMVVERMEWGVFYGMPKAFLELTPVSSVDEAKEVAARLRARAGDAEIRFLHGETELVDDPAAGFNLRAVALVYEGAEPTWAKFNEHHDAVREKWEERRRLEKHDTGEVNHRQEKARLAIRGLELELEKASDAGRAQVEAKLAEARAEFEEIKAWADREFTRIREEINAINTENERFQVLMSTAGEGTRPAAEVALHLDDIVRAYPANRLGLGEKLSLYVARWGEFLTAEPREANSEGGVYPAIFGTVAMTLIMSLAVVPFGVLAALYLREYAKPGPLVTAVRIAVNNLAGVPSIVFGVFGLGFFCYVVGGTIDEVFFSASLPNPTYGKGGLLWASLTLALLTLPVVIVATEEAVSAVPNSMREGSYACGASKWQTIKRIVLPRALPGIITGMILAIARGAGEVAPLMLVGAVKLAPELPIDTVAPFVHPERSFMHLGFHIYDVGFQSQNSEAAKPMVYTTTMLLITIVAVLNFTTIWIRNRLRKKFSGGQF